MRRIFLIAILSLFTTYAFAQDSLLTLVGRHVLPTACSSMIVQDTIMLAGSKSAISVYSVADPVHPAIISSLRIPDWAGPIQATESHIYVIYNGYQGDYIAIVNIEDLEFPYFEGIVPFPEIAEHRVSNGMLWVRTNGRNANISGYDISIPTRPRLICLLKLGYSTSGSIDIRDDILAANTSSGILKLFSIANLDSVYILGETTTSTGFIRLYDNYCLNANGSGLRFFDVTDPTQPEYAGRLDLFSNIRASDLVLDDGILYVITENLLLAYDFSNPAAPVLLSQSNPCCGPMKDLHKQLQFAYVGSESGMVHIYDVSDPNSPVDLDTPLRSQGWYNYVGFRDERLWYGGNPLGNLPIAELPTFNLNRMSAYSYEFVLGPDIYVKSRIYYRPPYYSDSYIQLYSITESDSIQLLSEIYYDDNSHTDFDYQGSFLAVSGYKHSFYDISNPEAPLELRSFDVPTRANDVAVSNSVVTYSWRSGTMWAYEMMDPNEPAICFQTDFGDTMFNSAVLGDVILYAAGDSGLIAYNFEQPYSPEIVSRFRRQGIVRVSTSEDSIVAVLESEQVESLDGWKFTLHAIDYHNVADPRLLASVELPDRPRASIMVDSREYLDCATNGEFFAVSMINALVVYRLDEDTGFQPPVNALPQLISLSAYPNPFNPSTTIAFDLNARAQVSLDVYDVTGRLVRTLINEQLNAGSYTHNFDAQGLPSGAYFARLVTPQVSQTARITLIR